MLTVNLTFIKRSPLLSGQLAISRGWPLIEVCRTVMRNVGDSRRESVLAVTLVAYLSNLIEALWKKEWISPSHCCRSEWAWSWHKSRLAFTHNAVICSLTQGSVDQCKVLSPCSSSCYCTYYLPKYASRVHKLDCGELFFYLKAGNSKKLWKLPCKLTVSRRQTSNMTQGQTSSEFHIHVHHQCRSKEEAT